MLARMSQGECPNLPPGANSNPIQYTLSLEMGTVQILDISPRPVFIKLQMWGQRQQNRIEKGRSMCYNIRTGGALLAQYLRDMKVTVVRLCDSRNNEQLGTGLLNWILFMRKTQIKQSPFMQDNFEFNVTIANYKKKQIAQVQLLVSWKKFVKREEDNMSQASQFRQSGYNRLGDYDKLQQSNDHILTNLGLPSKATFKDANQKQAIARHAKKIVSMMPNNQEDDDGNQYKMDALQPSPSQNQRSSLRKTNNATSNLIFSQSQPVPSSNIRYPQSAYELEKTKLKLQAEQFLTLTRKQYEYTAKNKPDMVTIRISDLVTLKPNVLVQFIDIYVFPKDSQQQSSDRKHMRIFSSAKNANAFMAEVVLQDKQIMEIQIGKGLARSTVEGKSLKQKQSIKVPLYSRNSKFGAITLTKIYELKQNKTIQQPISIQQQSKQTAKSKVENIRPSAISSPKNTPNPISNKNEGFLLINIKQAKHNRIPNFDISIKNYIFSKPYPSSNIIPISQLGSLFALQFRNTKNETFDSAIISDFASVPIPQHSLGCVALQNGWVQAENGYVQMQIMMGSMKQINYELSKENNYRNRNQQYMGDYIQRIKQQPNRINIKTVSDRINTEMASKIKQKQNKYQKYESNQNISLQESSQNNSKIKDQYSGKQKMDSKNRKMNKKSYRLKPGDMRTKTQPISQNKIINEQSSQQQLQNEGDDDLFLVQVLSRFLHALPAQKFSETPPGSIGQFQNLLVHFLSGRQQKQLISLVLDMFIDDTGEQEGQPAKLQYEQFMKCLKGYHNFVELWWKIRVDTLSKIIKDEPEYASKIIHYSELGMITRDKLWRKALSKVDNAQIKLKVDKMYNLNSQIPVSALMLIQDLKRIEQNPNEPPTQANPFMIKDLSKLIKQTIQSILQGSGFQAPSIAQDKVNIRIMCDTLQKLHVTLSYWQSLMLIQELKGWYNIDLQLNQGVVSASTVQVWLKSILNRSTVSSHSQPQRIRRQTQESNKKQQQAKIQSSPSPQQPKLQPQTQQPQQQPQQSVSQNASQRMLNSMRVAQNKSVARSQLNEQQIYNIASLLRDNDDFRMGTLSSEKPTYQVITNQNPSQARKGGSGMYNRILDDDIVDRTNQDKSESQSDIGNKVIISKPQAVVSKTPKYLYARIKSIKLKKELQYPIKLVMKIHDNKQQYFLCKQQQDMEGRQFVEHLNHNWQNKSQGLRMQLVKVQESRDQGHDQEEKQILVHGVLLYDDILDMGDNATKTKTIVLYANREIQGKASLEIKVSEQKPQIFHTDKQTKITIQISVDPKYERQWTHFTISTTNQLSYPNQPQNTVQANAVLANAENNKQQDMLLSQTFYKDVLVVDVNGVGRCSLPMEELYFKKELAGEYPVIGSDGQYLGNLYIRLCNPNTIMQGTTSMNMMSREILSQTNKVDKGTSAKYLIILDTISTLITSGSPLNIVCNIFIKDAISRSTLYRSAFYVQHQHPKGNPYMCTHLSEFSAQNYHIIQSHGGNSKQITIQLEYNGRHVGIGDHVINMGNFKHTNQDHDGYEYDGQGRPSRLGYTLKYVGSVNVGQVVMSMGVRVIPVPASFDKYNVFRIYRALAKLRYNAPGEQSTDMGNTAQNNMIYAQRMIGDDKKLTIIEQRLLKQITANKGGSILVNYSLPEANHAQLVKQLTFADVYKNGTVSYSQLKQILQSIMGADKSAQLLHCYASAYSSHSIDVSASAYVNSKMINSKSHMSKEQEQRMINYMDVLQFTYPVQGYEGHHHEPGEYLFKTNQNGSSIIDQVDRLHREIKHKYAK